LIQGTFLEMFLWRYIDSLSRSIGYEIKWKDMEAAAEAALTAAQERCTTLLVQSVANSARFPSSPMAPGPCTAAIAIRSIDLPGHPEDTKSKPI